MKEAVVADASLLQKVREEQDWTAIYQSFLDVNQPIRVLGSNEVPELQSSPVQRAARSSSPRRESPQKSPSRLLSRLRPKPSIGTGAHSSSGPLGLMPGNDWGKRLAALDRTGKKVMTSVPRSLSTAHGSVVILPMKRGRGRPPKNSVPAQKIILVPGLLQQQSSNKSEAPMDFAIERPLHYIHHQVDMEADVDDEESDEDDGEDDEGWIWNYEATAKRAVEYDMDEQDMAWLRLWNAERKAEGLERVDEDDFELTKAYQKWQSRAEEEEASAAMNGQQQDFQCEICGDGETTASNVIVICDGCDVAVHQECYGVIHIPEGPWLCRRCYIGGIDAKAKCCLCPWPNGALKQTTDPRRPWAHLLCAHYLPAQEAPVLNPTFQEPIDIHSIDPGRWSLLCQYCKSKVGAPMQCAIKTCHVAFHPLCAKHVGATLEHRSGLGYCWKHSPTTTVATAVVAGGEDEDVDVEKHDDDDNENDNDDDASGAAMSISSPHIKRGRGRPPKHQTPSRQQQQRSASLTVAPVPQINIAEHTLSATAPHHKRTGAAGHHSKASWLLEPVVPRVILDKLIRRDLSSSLTLSDPETLAVICRYWSLKRAHRRGMPLLRRLQLEPWTTSPLLPDTIDAARETRLYILEDLKRLRDIAELVLARERKKLAMVAAQHDIFQLASQPLHVIMRILLNTAIGKDPASFFAVPVSPEDVPDYLDIIPHPMDFSTMASNLEASRYPTLEAFLGDLQLIWDNALAYNQPDTIYYAAAVGLRDGMMPYIEAARKTIKDLKIKGHETILLSLLTEAQTPPPKKPVVAQSPEFGKAVWAPSSGNKHAYFPAITVDPKRGKPPAKLLPIPAGSILVRFCNPLKVWAVVPQESLLPLGKSLKEDLKQIEGLRRSSKTKLDPAEFSAAHRLALQTKSSL